jgi:predicted enzyme related to lactoylglutathione lyase
MVVHHGRFVWYELLTTDIAAAKAFYGEVVGWGARDASTPDLAYTLFSAGEAPVSGLMDLPEEARKMGATPRWVGYVAVDDLDETVDRIRRLGGAVYVPPTDTNVGRISVVADPQTANLALINGLKLRPSQPAEFDRPGRVGWHELAAADSKKAFGFYGELFGWQQPGDETPRPDSYRLFSADGQTIGGMSTKHPKVPVPFWLYYFNVDDIDITAEHVRSGGGLIFQGPTEIPGGNWIARCVDPQGAMFGLQGPRSQANIGRIPAAEVPASELGWSAEWDGISSKGRLVVPKPGPKR